MPSEECGDVSLDRTNVELARLPINKGRKPITVVLLPLVPEAAHVRPREEGSLGPFHRESDPIRKELHEHIQHSAHPLPAIRARWTCRNPDIFRRRLDINGFAVCCKVHFLSLLGDKAYTFLPHGSVEEPFTEAPKAGRTQMANLTL
jgi:hypothetical protein